MKDEEDEKTRRKKRQEKIKRDTMCYVCGCVLFSKIARPSNNFEFSKLPLPTLKEFNFPGNCLFVRLQIILFSRIIFAIIFAHMVSRKKAENLDFEAWFSGSKSRVWRMNFRRAVARGSRRASPSIPWTKAMSTSHSSTGTPLDEFETLDSEIACCLMNIRQEGFRKKINCHTTKLQDHERRDMSLGWYPTTSKSNSRAIIPCKM